MLFPRYFSPRQNNKNIQYKGHTKTRGQGDEDSYVESHFEWRVLEWCFKREERGRNRRFSRYSSRKSSVHSRESNACSHSFSSPSASRLHSLSLSLRLCIPLCRIAPSSHNSLVSFTTKSLPPPVCALILSCSALRSRAVWGGLSSWGFGEGRVFSFVGCTSAHSLSV